MKRLIILLTALMISVNAFCGHQLIKVDGWNCYIYLPTDYDQTEKSYPAILFIPGIGEVGTNAAKVIQNGPGAYITSGWNGVASNVQFIIISLQPVETWPNAGQLHSRMQILKSQYRIGAVFMTGLSMGGHSTHAYANTYPNEIKSIVTVEGVGLNLSEAEQMVGWSVWLDRGNKSLCFEQKNDLRGGTWVAGFLNKYKPNSAQYILTNFGGGGHCCWSDFYGGGGKQPGRFDALGGMNMYEWIAAQYFPMVPNFLIKLLFRDNTLSWECENTEDDDYFIIEESEDGVSFQQVGTVAATKGVTQYQFEMQ